MVKLLKMIIMAVFSLLPDSPFQDMVDGIAYDKDFIPFLNWYIPFDICATMTLAWLVCLLVYYGYVLVKKIIFQYLLNIILKFGGTV